MHKNIISILLLSISVCAAGQSKPLIDTGMIGTWPVILPYENGIALSGNGHYAAYIIYNQPEGRYSLTIQDLRNHWKKTIISANARILFFTADNRHLCWQQGDSIWLQSTGNGQGRLLGVCREISHLPNAKGEWIALPGDRYDSSFRLINLVTGKEKIFTSIKSYRWLSGGRKLLLATSVGDLKLLDLASSKELTFNDVKDYALSPAEKSMVFLTERGVTKSLQWVGLEGGEPVTIWTGKLVEQLRGYVYDKASEQLAFSVQSLDEEMTIWYYKVGLSAAIQQTADKLISLSGDMTVSGIRAFSGDGRWLFFNVRKKLPMLPTETTIASVDIWSYQDEVLNPAQTGETTGFRDYAAVMEVASKKTRLLEQHDNERIIGWLQGDYVLLIKDRIDVSLGNWWPHSAPPSNWLVSLQDGRRKLIKGLKSGVLLTRSPDQRWLYYWDPELGHFFSVDPLTCKTVNLTAVLPVTVADDVEQPIQAVPAGIAGWCTGDSAVLIYDNYDIWKLDPAGNKAPVNITGGYGRIHGIKLRFVYRNRNKTHPSSEELLSGYDVLSKCNGFFNVRLDEPGSLDLLTMGPYNYYQTTVYKQPFGGSLQPLVGGAGKNKRWIVMRQSATEYPNFYVSKDLKKFIPLTNLQPQKKYNWLTAEPVSWQMYNGATNTGVLYKPENFDPTQKYPIIFNYYEKYAQRCYQFPMPGLTADNINIPWFVSRGYLVFTPDIQYTVASNPGGMTISEAAHNAVASAAEYLSQRPYIDKARMAIQGHSFGGHETNGIITQSNLFAAAAEVAGYSDHLSAYLTLVTGDEGSSNEKYHKIDHFNQRMGATPWERPDLFRLNSPVQLADKVTTPLLIVHNKKDGSVNFRQGVAMYMAMRRLGKPCWLLQYDNSGHVLKDKDALDYTIRLTQYFDHYLKGTPAPQWMTMNTLAGYKGKNNLYTLDPRGHCFKDCLNCNIWNKKEKEAQQ